MVWFCTKLFRDFFDDKIGNENFIFLSVFPFPLFFLAGWGRAHYSLVAKAQYVWILLLPLQLTCCLV